MSSISYGFIDLHWANTMAQGVLNGVAFDFTTLSSSLYLGIFVNNALSTEMAGGSYTRQSITFGTVGAYPGFNAANTNTITFSNVPAANIYGWGLYSHPTDATKMLYYWDNTTGAGFPGTPTPIPVSDGDTVVLNPGAFTLAFA